MPEESTSQPRTSNGSSVKVSIIDLPKLARKLSRTKSINISEPETETPNYLRMFVAEFFGTAFLMFGGCMGCIRNYDDPLTGNARPDYMGAVVFGLTVMSIIQMLGHISGAHLNPAVTIATVLFRMLTVRMAAVYVIAQFLGATLGFGLLKVLVSDHYAPDGFCMTTVDPKISVFQGLGLEIAFTVILIFVCCAVWDRRNEKNSDSVPLRFGFVIVLLSLIGGKLTGASMNTARSFGPVVFGGSWDDQWIYWVGPNIAPFIACGFYKFVFGEQKEEDLHKERIFLEEINAGDKAKA